MSDQRKNLKNYIREIIKEVEDEIEESTTTGDVAGYETPNAFGNGSNKSKKKTKDVATQAGYDLVEGNWSLTHVYSLAKNMLDKRIPRQVINIPNPNQLNKFLKQSKPAIKSGILNINKNPINPSQLWLTLGPNAERKLAVEGKFIIETKGMGMYELMKMKLFLSKNKNVKYTRKEDRQTGGIDYVLYGSTSEFFNDIQKSGLEQINHKDLDPSEKSTVYVTVQVPPNVRVLYIVNPKSSDLKEDTIPGGLADGKSLEDIANKHKVDIDQLLPEFRKGIKVEMEHTSDTNIAKEIALDHLFEDPNYYSKLSTIETESTIKEGIWPKSKLSDAFQFKLASELRKKFKGIFYVDGMDLYRNDKKLFTINGDTDSVNSIVARIKNMTESILKEVVDIKIGESNEDLNLKKIHGDILNYLKSIKGVSEVRELSEFPNKHGHNISTFSVRYNVGDKYNYSKQEIKIDYSDGRVFIPSNGYFPFKSTKDIINIIDKKTKLKESIHESIIHERQLKIPGVGEIDDFKLLSNLRKNPKVRELLNDKEWDLLWDRDAEAIGVERKPADFIVTNGKMEIEFSLFKDGKVKKSLRKARPAISDFYSKYNKNESYDPKAFNPNFIKGIGQVWNDKYKDMYSRNEKFQNALNPQEKKLFNNRYTKLVGSERDLITVTDGKQEFEVNTKLNKVVKPIKPASSEIQNHWKQMKNSPVVSESKKSARPVNRWLELKNDETPPNKKLALGLKELKYKLREVENFVRWYNKLNKMNELSSDSYWKRTNNHIYKIKERLINIARTIQEIEK